MLAVELLVSEFLGEVLGRLDGLLGLDGEFVEVHRVPLASRMSNT
jgi:hypothetical protein